MKKSFFLLLAVGCAALTIAAKEAVAPKGTIHPARHTKTFDLPALAKISFNQALVNALAAQPGAVVKGELEVEDRCLMYFFEIVGADRKITEVEIDAGDGSLLGKEDEKD